MDDKSKIKQLLAENHDLKEQLQNYIPRRRVRRVFKQLKAILQQDIQDESKIHIEHLKQVVNKIEKEGYVMVGQDVKQSLEYILSSYEIGDK